MGTLCEYIKMCGSNHTSSFKYLHTEVRTCLLYSYKIVSCDVLGKTFTVCGKGSVSLFFFFVPFSHWEQMQGVKDECGICKVVVETVQNILKANKTLVSIREGGGAHTERGDQGLILLLA